jgi:hypothetical protein
MNGKQKVLETEIDTLNPRYKIEQSLLPRLERARDKYSIDQDIYVHGKRLLRKPKLVDVGRQSYQKEIRAVYDDDNLKGIKYYFPTGCNQHDQYEKARIQFNLDKLRTQDEDNSKQANQKPSVSFKDDVEHELSSEMIVKGSAVVA